MDRQNSDAPTRRQSATMSSGVGNDYQSLTEPMQGMFQKFATIATTAGKLAHKGVTKAGGIISDTVLTTADAVGLRDKVEAAEKMARKAGIKGVADATKAMNKARRMANKAIDFDAEEALDSSDYDLLMSADGAVERHISAFGNHSQTFVVPAGSAMVFKARVKKFDIGFSVREIKETEGIPVIIEPLAVRGSENNIQGEIPKSTRNRNINLLFDNSHSPLQRKTVVFWVSIGEKASLADDQCGAARTKEVLAADMGPPELQ